MNDKKVIIALAIGGVIGAILVSAQLKVEIKTSDNNLASKTTRIMKE